MKAFERIFLYSVLALLVCYVFLVDGNVESQVAIQEDVRARSISIVNDAGQVVVNLYANEDGGVIFISNKAGTPIAGMAAYENDGMISVYNKQGDLIGSLP